MWSVNLVVKHKWRENTRAARAQWPRIRFDRGFLPGSEDQVGTDGKKARREAAKKYKRGLALPGRVGIIRLVLLEGGLRA